MAKLFTSIAVVLTAICLAGSAWALSSTPVTVVNPADIAKAEGIQTPFQGFARCDFSIDLCTGQISIPLSQRLVIEFVTGSCLVTGNNVISRVTMTTFSAGIDVTHDLNKNAPAPAANGTLGRVAVSELVRAYADAGSGAVGFEFDSSGPNDGFGCVFTVSGQLVAVP
jgi:hypothetical protein